MLGLAEEVEGVKLWASVLDAGQGAGCFPECWSPNSGLQQLDARATWQAFLSNLGFKSWMDDGIGGFGPLECATASGHVAMIRAALRAGVSPHRQLRAPVWNLVVPFFAETYKLAHYSSSAVQHLKRYCHD